MRAGQRREAACSWPRAHTRRCLRVDAPTHASPPAQLVELDYCGQVFGDLYDHWPDHNITGLRPDAKVGDICRVSCRTCHEIKEEL